ncbi:MAG: HEAT repeat domain-containing protein, partial [Blastocatellia bacterium]
MMQPQAETFERSLELMRLQLSQVNGTLILVCVTDDSNLRDHAVAELARSLDPSTELRGFRYDPDHLSLLEGASSVASGAASGANGKRVAVSVAGLESLPREDQSNAIKLLNAQRNRLADAHLAIILWLNRALFAEVAAKASDFYAWRSSTFFIEPPSDWSAERRLESQRRSYLQAIVDQNQYVNLQGLAPMRGGQLVQMRMEEIFILLRVEQEVRAAQSEVAMFFAGHGSSLLERSIDESLDKIEIGLPPLEFLQQRVGRLNRETVSRSAEIPDLLRERRAIVLGDPGAGKTTMLRYVAYRVASEMLGRCSTGSVSDLRLDEEAAAGDPGRSRSPYCTALPDEVADCLPVYVRIGLYAQHLKEHPDATIAEFAPKQNYQLPLTPELLQHQMEQGKALFLLDGLDEIVDTAQRQDVARRVNEFALENPDCPVIVTSRIVGYPAASLGSSFEQFTVRPFDDEEIEQFVRHWYQTLGEPERADDLIASLKQNPSVRRLATNPLLLTVTALIHRRKTKLPSRRVELYEDAAKTLADSWMSERRLTPDDWNAEEALDDLLPAIAWRLHSESSGGLIGQDDLHQLLVETMRAGNPRLTEAEAHARAAQFRRNVSEFSGIFLERGLDETGRGLYGFLHLTFEEYFAAIALKDRWKRERDKVLKPLLHHPRWTEVILLCAGTMDSFDASRFVEAILGARSQYDAILHRDLLLAARVLADDVRIEPPLRRQIVEQLGDLYFAESSPWALCEDIQKAFAGLAGTLANAEVVEVLGQRLSDDTESLRSAAAQALAAMGEHAATPEIIEKLFTLLDDDKLDVYLAVADALGAMGERISLPNIIERLITRLDSSNLAVRVGVVRIFEGLGEHAATPEVIKKLVTRLGDSEGAMRDGAAIALGAMGKHAAKPEIIEKLIAWLEASEWILRDGAVRALGVIGKDFVSPSVFEKLIPLLDDSEISVRSAATRAIGKVKPIAVAPAIIEKLISLLMSDEWAVRLAAAETLGKMGDQVATSGVIEVLAASLD